MKKKACEKGEGLWQDLGPQPRLDNGVLMFCKACEEDHRILDNDTYVKFHTEWESEIGNTRNYKYNELRHPKTIPDSRNFTNSELFWGNDNQCVARKWRKKVIDGGYEDAGRHPAFPDGSPMFCHRCDWDDKFGSGIWRIGAGFGTCPCLECKYFLTKGVKVYSHSKNCCRTKCNDERLEEGMGKMGHPINMQESADDVTVYEEKDEKCIVLKWRKNYRKSLVTGENPDQHPSFHDGKPGKPMYCHECDWFYLHLGPVWKMKKNFGPKQMGPGFLSCPCNKCKDKKSEVEEENKEEHGGGSDDDTDSDDSSISGNNDYNKGEETEETEEEEMEDMAKEVVKNLVQELVEEDEKVNEEEDEEGHSET